MGMELIEAFPLFCLRRALCTSLRDITSWDLEGPLRRQERDSLLRCCCLDGKLGRALSVVEEGDADARPWKE